MTSPSRSRNAAKRYQRLRKNNQCIRCQEQLDKEEIHTNCKTCRAKIEEIRIANATKKRGEQIGKYNSNWNSTRKEKSRV